MNKCVIIIICIIFIIIIIGLVSYCIYKSYHNNKLIGGIKTSYNEITDENDDIKHISPIDVIDIYIDLISQSIYEIDDTSCEFDLNECNNRIIKYIEFIKNIKSNNISENDLNIIKSMLELYDNNKDEFNKKIYNVSDIIYSLVSTHIGYTKKYIDVFDNTFYKHTLLLFKSELNDYKLNSLSRSLCNYSNVINNVINMSKDSQKYITSLLPSIIECLVVLESKHISIKIFNYIDHGSYNIVYSAFVNKKPYALRLYKGTNSLDGTSIYEKEKIDNLFKDIISYPTPIYASYKYKKAPIESNDVIWTCWTISNIYRNRPIKQDDRTNDIDEIDGITKYDYIVSQNYKTSSNKTKEEHESLRFNTILRYIDQMSQILFRLHENTNYVYCDWKISNIALDDNFNFILVDNDFQKINENSFINYISTHNYTSILDKSKYNLTTLGDNKLIAQSIDKMILLKELYTCYIAKDDYEHNSLYDENIYSRTDLKKELNEIFVKIDKNKYKYCYNLIEWYLNSNIKKIS